MITFRELQPADMEFLWEMLYEAVFWRERPDKPTLQEGLALPEIRNALKGWKTRDGDTAIVAFDGDTPVGAVWYRYWTDENNMRGYYKEDIPVLVIGVHQEYRRKGIGVRLIKELQNQAVKDSINQISLCVSKDNIAMGLYEKTGFVSQLDIGDSLIMTWQK